ncbi:MULTISPECIES: ABC transporter permease [unclassified Oceanobacillus]|uniref:ABC transporter permease n=1 Tax=unclassified Oceanobacillus TaxID=2630292 RepID=UPI0012EBFE8C|nr:ABC transporter permease [Oceanobacillus sp. AG]
MKKYIQEMLKRKDLLYYLVKSGLKAEHRNSYLGYFWWLLDPLLNVLVYYFLVVIVLNRGGEDYPLFLVVGLVVWRWISTTINSSSRSILRYSSIVNQVALPKAIFPISFTLTQLFNFMFGLVVIALFLAVYGVKPTWFMLYLPVLIVLQLVVHIALGLVLGYITIFVRDIENLMTYITRIFFYASPIIWEGARLLRSEKVPDWLIPLVEYNPVAILVTSYRDILIYHQQPNWIGLGGLFVIATIVVIYMMNYYSKNEHKIIKAL